MRIVDEQVIERFARRHADCRAWLENWVRNARQATWRTIQDVKKTYPATDAGARVRSGGTVTVFDVCGNRYRMIVSVIYRIGTIVVHELMTHAEYSTDRWKEKY
jgi:mRNA interferase HigB